MFLIFLNAGPNFILAFQSLFRTKVIFNLGRVGGIPLNPPISSTLLSIFVFFSELKSHIPCDMEFHAEKLLAMKFSSFYIP